MVSVYFPVFSHLPRIVLVFLLLSLPSASLVMAEPRSSSPEPPQNKTLFTLDDEASKRLFQAVAKLLSETADERSKAHKLPSESDFIVPPLWRETKEQRMRDIQDLLDAALDVVTDVPLVQLQQRIEKARTSIDQLEDQITALREKRLSAPDDALLPGILSDTVASIDDDIKDLETRVQANKGDIETAKTDIHQALARSGVEISKEQMELLLGSVLGGDMMKMVAAFQASRHIDQRLSALMDQAGGEIKTSRRYFAMHAALFAMLLHAQNHIIEKIDMVYQPRMKKIISEIRTARAETRKLLRGRNREDQVRVLNSNLKAQAFSERVALFYRDYLTTQRAQIVRARAKTKRDLRIADNTYLTVEASFKLKSLIDDAQSSFEALQLLETPGFDQVFKNEDLRREFESLTEKLGVPSS